MRPNGIPLDTATVVSTVLEGILYGISILMFIGTMWSLMYRHTMHFVVNRRLIIVACSLLLLSTAHVVIDIIRAYKGLVEYRDSPAYPKGPNQFFADVAQWTFVWKNAIYLLQTLVGDGVVIYRCYVVWQSWWAIIFPTVLWVSVAVTGVGSVYSDSHPTGNKENVFSSGTGQWITAFLVATLFTNLVSTSFLAFRIWQVGKRVSRSASHSSVLWPVLRIVLDAGVLYSVSLLAALLCFIKENRGLFVLIDMIMPIISITFYMVIIRITLSTSHSRSAQMSVGSGRLTYPRMSRVSGMRDSPLKRMEVHITQLTEMSRPDEYAYAEGSGEFKEGAMEGEVASRSHDDFVI